MRNATDSKKVLGRDEALIWSSECSYYHGHQANVIILKNWLGQVRNHIEVAVVTGPCGVGKTALVKRCAQELGLAVHSFGADDLANPGIVASRVLPAILNKGFQPGVVVIDDVVPSQLLCHLQQKAYRINSLILTKENRSTTLPPGIKRLALDLQLLNPSQLQQVVVEFGPTVPNSEFLINQCRGDARKLIDSIQFGVTTEVEVPEEEDSPEEDNSYSGEDSTTGRALRLVCLLRRCTKLQLLDELWLLPTYRHTVESLFTAVATDGTTYHYQPHHDPEDHTTTAKVKLLTRLIDRARTSWQEEKGIIALSH